MKLIRAYGGEFYQMMYKTPPVMSKVVWATGTTQKESVCQRSAGREIRRHESLPRAMSEKKAPHQSIKRKIQLNPITRPCRFQISRYGGSNPTARSTAATMPMTRMGALFPLLYMGCEAHGQHGPCSLRGRD